MNSTTSGSWCRKIKENFSKRRSKSVIFIESKTINLKCMQSQLLNIQTFGNRVLFEAEFREVLSLSATFPALDGKVAIEKRARIKTDFTQLKLVYYLTIALRLSSKYSHSCAKLIFIDFLSNSLFCNTDCT